MIKKHIGKIIFILMIGATLLQIVSCVSDATPESYISEYYGHSSWRDDTLTAGNKLAFYYNYVAAQSNNALDDEYEEWLRFSIDSSLTEFNLSDSNLVPLNARWKSACFCAICRDTLPIRHGTMSGKKILNDVFHQNTWHITADLTISDTFRVCRNLKIDRDFYLRDK